jgi:hypothetical protein
MSTKYPGGFITKAPVAPTSSAASGIWTLDQQQQAQKAGTWPAPPIFIEDIFSTYLYAGNNSTQTITNGIDLSGKGGMVWTKSRTTNPSNHGVIDTVRGNRNSIYPNLPGAQDAAPDDTWGITGFNSTGYGIGTSYSFSINNSGENYASWTFREQPKFFDIVTYTGDGIAGRTVAHNLGAVPGCIIVKCVTQSENWYVYHQALGNTQTMVLNQTAAQGTDPSWNNTTPTSTVFTVGSNSQVNFSGRTYVAYLFASNAGGFPVSGGGSTNGITCGSYTTDGSGNATINLGYEPQWLLQKSSNASGNWFIADVMRGMTVSANAQLLRPNLDIPESAGSPILPTPTGYTVTSFVPSTTYIYIAIRRGPMKTPTTGTSVFNPVLGVSTAPAFRSSNFNSGIDSAINFYKPGYTGYSRWSSRLTGTGVIPTSNTTAEVAVTQNTFDYMNGYYSLTGLDTDFGAWMFKRAPGFHDVVCYTGNGSGSGQVITHNLGVTPELIIIRSRSGAYQWHVYAAPLGQSKALFLEDTSAEQANSAFTGGTINSSQFQLKVDFANVNGSGVTYVSYLFATLAGVSKVGTYTGTGALLTVNCGFTSGARFVLIKRTDSTGGWYTYDSVRGITSGNDPYLLINSDAAEVTGTNYVDTDTTGFQVTAAAPAGLNASGGTYIFLAIA